MICQKAMSKETELMELGETVEWFSVPPHPKGISLEGKLVVLKPLKASDYSKELFEANSLDKDGLNWTYLHYGPFETEAEYANWIMSFERSDDPIFFAILSKKLDKAVGIASSLRIKPYIGSV